MLLRFLAHFRSHHTCRQGEQGAPRLESITRLIAFFLDQRAPVINQGLLLWSFIQGIGGYYF